MGLFGGFKGKLIGKTRKEKKEKPSHVVCVKFNTFSEFEPGPSASTSNGNLGRNDVVKERRRPTKPEIKNVFGQIANGDAVVPTTKPKAKVTAPITSTTNIVTPTKSPTSTTNETKSSTKAAAPTKPSTSATPATTSSTKATTAPKPPTSNATKTQAPKVPTPAAKKPEVVDDVKNEDEPSPVLFTKTIQFPLLPTDSDSDDGNFKINFAARISQVSSEEEESSSGDDDIDMSAMNFSSQATSIFFGEDEEPKVMRPRRVVVDDDDLSDGSSASA